MMIKRFKSFASIFFIIALYNFMAISCKAQYKKDKNKLSGEIFSSQRIEFKGDQNLGVLNTYRLESDCFNKLQYSIYNDTVFILEKNGIQGDYLLTIWNSKDTLSYSNFTGHFALSREPLFIDHMAKLISDWNIQEIGREEQINSDILPSEYIYATRIIFQNKKTKIDCIRFKEFFNKDRDLRK